MSIWVNIMRCRGVAKIYNTKNKFLYEILDDYKEGTEEQRENIFNAFIDLIYSNNSCRQISDKYISFTVSKNLINTSIGQALLPYQQIKYDWISSKTNVTDFVSLIRQKINNIYTYYCDSNICTGKEYMQLLHTPQRMYNRWIKDELNLNADKLTQVIKDSLNRAGEIKHLYAKQKMNICWDDFKSFTIPCLRKAFDNFIPLDEFSCRNEFIETTDGWCEDNFPVKYLCRCLGYGIKNYQKSYYGLYVKGSHNKLIYKRCLDCGNLFQSNKYATKTVRCKDCQLKITRKKTNCRVQKFRNKECNVSII